MNTREKGKEYEDLAAAYLEEKGYEILERNFRCRAGEIDLVARQGACLVFVEVKYRKTGGFGEASLAVDRTKQRRLSRAAAVYLLEKGFSPETPCRFDVISVTGEERKHYINAFDFTG